MGSRNTIILIAFLSALYVSVLSGISSAAGEVDCRELIAKIKGGTRYITSINVQKEAMRVQTATDYCFDPIDSWIKRGLPLASNQAPSSGGSQSGKTGGGNNAASVPPPADGGPPTVSPDGIVIPSR